MNAIPEPWVHPLTGAVQRAHMVIGPSRWDPNPGQPKVVETACGETFLAAGLIHEPWNYDWVCDKCIDDTLGVEIGWVVYQFSEPSGRSVYIGYSGNLMRRLDAHAKKKAAWLKPGLELNYIRCPDQETAQSLERTLIRALEPTHNIWCNKAHPDNRANHFARLRAERKAA